MKRQFYAVKWGNNIRISDKVDSVGEACRNTYGMISSNMEIIPLGGNKEMVRKALRADLYKRTDWKTIGELVVST